MFCVCVHRAIDVQREAEQSGCKDERAKDRWVGGRNMRDGEENWKIGSWDGEKMLNRRANTGESHIRYREIVVREKRVRRKRQVGSQRKRESGRKSARVTCIVDACDNGKGGEGGRKKKLRVDFFCLPLFSARSQQVWVWTAGERIDVSFSSQNTLLHL